MNICLIHLKCKADNEDESRTAHSDMRENPPEFSQQFVRIKTPLLKPFHRVNPY